MFGLLVYHRIMLFRSLIYGLVDLRIRLLFVILRAGLLCGLCVGVLTRRCVEVFVLLDCWIVYLSDMCVCLLGLVCWFDWCLFVSLLACLFANPLTYLFDCLCFSDCWFIGLFIC